MTETTTSLALVAILGTVVTALFKLLSANTKALERLVESNQQIAKETKKGADEARTRNGSLGDLVHQGNQLTKKVLKRLEKTAVIAAEDRDVLTNQNIHIVTEVDRRMKKKP